MQVENDPNVLYGGDPDESAAIDMNCPSLGHLILSDLKLGENKPSFVSIFYWTLNGSKVKLLILPYEDQWIDQCGVDV